MKRVLPLVAVALLLIGFAGVFAVDKPITVGDFALRYAKALRLAGEGSTPDQALEALRAAGVLNAEKLRLDARLTEGDVVLISESMNLGIATDNPEREFSLSQTDTFFEVFGSALTLDTMNSELVLTPEEDAHKVKTRNPNAADPRLRGKGKKKGLSAHFPFD